MDRVAALFAYYPYRCRECGSRFLEREAAPQCGPSSVEAELRATLAIRTRKRKRRECVLYGCALILFLVFLYGLVFRAGISGNGG